MVGEWKPECETSDQSVNTDDVLVGSFCNYRAGIWVAATSEAWSLTLCVIGPTSNGEW